MKNPNKFNMCIILCYLFIFSYFVLAQTDKPKINETVFTKLTTRNEIRVGITFKDHFLDYKEVTSSLNNSEFKIISYGSDGGWVFGELSLVGLNKLKEDTRINYIYLPDEYRIILGVSKNIINVKDVWDLGYKGEDQAVCVIDSGIDTSHNSFSGRIAAERCFCNINEGSNPNCCPDGSGNQTGSGSAEDNNGHGTHVAGIIAADRIVEGVAKKSKIVAVKVCNSSGDCDPSGIPQAINWCRQNKDNYNIDSISLSLGSSVTYNNPNSCNVFAEGIEVNKSYNIERIPVVAASGNDGETNGISSPACASGAISVGASTKIFDGIWSDTNRDEILDLLAPGSLILSTWHSFPYYNILSGTSMAAPYVAGAIALLKEADDTNSVTNSPMNVRELLKETGKQIYDSASGLRIPRLDILKAFQIDWPMFHHDLRRTGFTLLKGDLDKTKIDQASFKISSIDNTFVDFPVLANIDNDEQQEILVGLSRFGQASTLFGAFYAIECIEKKGKCKNFRELWSFSDGFIIGESPTVDDLNNDGRKEVVFVTGGGSNVNGIVYAIDGNKKGGLSFEPNDAIWKYTITQSQASEGDILHNAIADIDLDGKKEVLVSDYSGVLNWQGYLYVLDPNPNSKTFTLQQQLAIGPSSTSGGAAGAIAVANINSSDDYPEVIVPSNFGIYVYRYNSVTGNLEKIWNNSNAEIKETALVADVDADNNYEVVYATSDYSSTTCPTVGCTRKLYVVNALTGAEKCSVTLSEYPISSPAVGNLDLDKELEIAIVTRASEGSGSSYGHIRTFEHNCVAKNTFPGTNDHDTQRSSADIADIDNDEKNDVVFSVKNGTIYVMDNNLNLKWVYYLGGEIIGTPALGDLDGDGALEIVAKHVTETSSSAMSLNESFTRVWDPRTFREDKDKISPFSMLTTADATLKVVGGNNTQPELEFIEDVYAIEGTYININSTIIYLDDDNDKLKILFSSPLNETNGTWQTNSSDAGVYEIFTEVSDGNLTDSRFFTLTIFENNTLFNYTFEDGKKEENLTYTQAGNHSVNITLPQNAKILRAAIDISGFFTEKLNQTFYEQTPVVIEANELNNSLNSSLIIDKDWSTYYSAGSATGAIVELRDSDILSEVDHVIFHLKLGIFGGGIGRFGIYNYNTNKYEIVTSSIIPFNETSKDFYFDIYKTSPLWLNNDTNFAMQTNNITKYINGNKTRWYYRYLGEWASQRIYESEVRFEKEIIYPDTISLGVGYNGFDYILEGELHDKFIKQDRLNNSRKNETINLNINSSAARYINLPKNAEITSAYLTVGDKNVETLSTLQEEVDVQKEIDEKKKEWINKNLKKGINYDTSYNDDGTFTQRISPLPINYLDNGEYKPIDTKIIPSVNGNYEVTKGIYKVFFRNLNEGIRVEDDNSYTNFKPVSLGPNGLNIDSKIANQNKLTFKNIFGEGIDLEYEYKSNELKENLVIRDFNSLPDFSGEYLEFNFVIDSNLDFYINGEKWDKQTIKETMNDIELKLNGEVLFNLVKPFAIDANNKIEALIYQLSQNSGSLHLTIRVPESFLINAEYPIIIDPTIEKKIIVSEDCHLDEAEPSTDHNYDQIQVEQNTVGNKIRGLVKYDLSSIKNAQNITAAKLYMYTDVVSSGISCPGVEDSVDVYRKVEDGWSESTANWNNDKNYDTSSFLDRVCTSSANTWYEWDVVGTLGLSYPRGVYYEYFQDSTKKVSFILKIDDEESATRGYVQLSAGDNYINVTYIPNEPPVLVGCRDDSTLMNTDGSDILVDLWACHYDTDDSPSESTFSIVSESNTGLIDCSITGNRNLTCGAPATNQAGYSDIVVSVNDSVYADNDTIRISVLAPGDISLFINGTRVYRNLHSNYDEVAISSEIKNYLDICINDSFGNCQVPINITSHDNKVNFTINSIDIDYNLRELEFSEALQSYIDNSCIGNCSVPLTFGLKSKGRLNISDLQIYYNITEEIPAPNDTNKFFVDNSSGSAVAWFGDLGNIVLKGTCTQNASCSAPSNSYIVDGVSGGVVAYVDSQGNLCIETGDCSDQSTSCSTTNGGVIVENQTGTVVSYIDNTGDLCLIGRLYQNSSP